MRYTTLPLALLLLGVAGHTGAQTAPTLSAKASAPLTLAQALAKLPPPARGILLAVGADKVPLPDGTLPPPADASVTVLANTFGDITQDFGSVTALAPATRVLLNPDPGPPDVTTGVSSYTGFNMFAASLDDAQWKMLTSEGGLGLSDLTDDTQKLLFHGLFPSGQLWVATRDPAQEKLPKDQRTDTRNVSDQIDGVRLRMRQTSEITLHDKKSRPIFYSVPISDPTRLRTWSPLNSRAATQNNVILRAVTSNTPQSSDLHLSEAKFQQAITLTGVKTVGELAARIAAKTYTELYADPHYASRLLTVIGSTHDTPAVDVLAALALAVAGTYRQVGPAFVLTNDLEGVGRRRKRLQNWETGAETVMSKLKDEAGETLLKNRLSSARSLPTFGDPLALTPTQMAGMKESLILLGVPGEDENYPYAKLTPAQQQEAHRIADAYDAETDNRSGDALPREPNPTGNVILAADYAIQFLIPTVQGPVDSGNSNGIGVALSSFYWPGHSTAPNMEAEEAKEAAEAAGPQPPVPPLLPLPLLLRSRPRRAVLGHPATPAAVDALVAAMQKIGLNELWLDVFSKGKSHLADKGTDILTEALTKTQGTGIAVYADLSLLAWGNTPPNDVRDLTLLGQSSRAADIADHARKGSDEDNYDAAGKPIAYVPPPIYASPVSDTVKKTLADTVRSLASHSGLAGFVWEDAVRGGDLGYTPAMRLAFLRAFHADPLDITPGGYAFNDVSLPTFDDKAVETALTKHWDEARLGANTLLLTELRQAIPATVDKPILMDRTDYMTPWLVTWDDPHQMPPPLRTLFQGAYPSAEQVAAEAVKQGRSAIVRVTVKDAADTAALARSLQTDLPLPTAKSKAAWDGYVLNFGNPHVTDSTEPLRDLMQAVTPNP